MPPVCPALSSTSHKCQEAPQSTRAVGPYEVRVHLENRGERKDLLENIYCSAPQIHEASHTVNRAGVMDEILLKFYNLES